MYSVFMYSVYMYSVCIQYAFNALTKVPHDKLQYVLNEITDFACKGGRRDHVTVIIQEHFNYCQKVKLEDLTLSKK